MEKPQPVPYSFIYDSSAYADAPKVPYHDVPIYPATAERLANFGNLVSDFHAENVTRVTWPKTTGWRHLTAGSGNQQAVVEGDYIMRWDGDLLYGDNIAVGEMGMGFVTGRTSKEADVSGGDVTASRSHVLTRDSNYHPDGGQVCSCTLWIWDIGKNESGLLESDQLMKLYVCPVYAN